MGTRTKKPAAVKPDQALVKGFADYGEQDGFDNQTQDDVALPFIALAQSNSPEVNKDDDRYIDGCEAGAFFNTVTREVYADGVLFQPVYREHAFVEWVPRDSGGGFVGRHAPDDPVVRAARQRSAINELTTEESGGNQLVETFYWYGHILPSIDALASGMPAVIAFKSTAIKVYKGINTRLRTFNPPQIGKRPPLFAHRLKITSRGAKNAKGQFKQWQVDPAVDGDLMASLIRPDGPQAALLQEAQILRKLIEEGVAKANFDQEGTGARGENDETFQATGDDCPI